MASPGMGLMSVVTREKLAIDCLLYDEERRRFRFAAVTSTLIHTVSSLPYFFSYHFGLRDLCYPSNGEYCIHGKCRDKRMLERHLAHGGAQNATRRTRSQQSG